MPTSLPERRSFRPRPDLVIFFLLALAASLFYHRTGRSGTNGRRRRAHFVVLRLSRTAFHCA